MASKYIDTDEVRKRTIEMLKQNYVNRDIIYRIEAGTATEADKETYRSFYNRAYAQMRQELKQKSANFWEKATAGNLKEQLRKMGLSLNRGKVQWIDNGEPVLRFWLEHQVIPALEELGLTGFKLPKRVSAMTQNVLDFSAVDVKTAIRTEVPYSNKAEENESETESEN